MNSNSFFFEVFCATIDEYGNTKGTRNSKCLMFQLVCDSMVHVRC